MDGDVFTRRVRRVWKRLADALATRSDPTVCASLLESALAADLREGGGLRALGLSPEGIAGSDGAIDIVTGALKRTWRVQVVERVAPILIGHGVFESYDDVWNFVGRVDEGARFDSLAGAVLRRPDGAGIRKPPRRRTSVSTLLGEAAPLGDRA